jgi:hypothetical protein
MQSPVRYCTLRRWIDGKIADIAASAGNTVRRFYGTTRACSIGDSDGHQRCCANASCVVCNIIKTGFQLKFASAGRFGRHAFAAAQR